MQASLERARSLVRELRRRRVFRVALGYGIVGWLLVQIADTTFPVLQLPSWTVTFVVVAVLLGFPIAIVLSWAFDITPDRGGSPDTAPAPSSAAGGSPGAAQAAPTVSAEPPEPVAERAHPHLRHATPFVGRAAELARLTALLRDPSVRLVNVCGPPGIGKSRLAAEVATMQDGLFRDGVGFVSLASASSTEAMVSRIAEQLGIRSAPHGEAKTQLLDFLRDRQMLLVLDNLEHLDAAHLIAELVDVAAEVKLLATSVQRLELHGEVTFPLSGLTLPADGRPDEADSVRLFLECARRADVAFEPAPAELDAVRRICDTVQGIPLALELAAAWVRALPCGEILREIERDHDFLASKLHDVPERHRSLRAAFEAGWRLLPDGERRVLRRLSRFRGGFTRDAAAEVAGATIVQLSALIDSSLVRRAAAERYEIIEVLRQFAADKLGEDPEEVDHVDSRYVRHFIGRLAGVERAGVESAAHIDALASDAENIRLAWLAAVERRDLAALKAGLDGVFALHDHRGWAREGCRILGAAVAAVDTRDVAGEPERALLLGRLEVRAGIFSLRLGQQERAEQLVESGLERLPPAERWERAFALDALGLLAFRRGDYRRARQVHVESLELFRALDDRAQVGRVLPHLGHTAFAIGAYAEAKERYLEGLGVLRSVGDETRTWTPLCNLGIIHFHEQAFEDAERCFREALAVARSLGNARGVANALQNLGYACYRTGWLADAEMHLVEAVEICEAMGYAGLRVYCVNALADVARARGDVDRAGQLYRQALAGAVRGGETPLVLEVLLGIARLLDLAGRWEGAVELLALVRQHPAADSSARDGAAEMLDELSARQVGALEDPLARGSVADLDATVAALLAGDLGAAGRAAPFSGSDAPAPPAPRPGSTPAAAATSAGSSAGSPAPPSDDST